MALKTGELISEFNPHCTHKNVGGGPFLCSHMCLYHVLSVQFNQLLCAPSLSSVWGQIAVAGPQSQGWLTLRK